MTPQDLSFTEIHRDWYKVTYLGRNIGELFQGMGNWWVVTPQGRAKFGKLRAAEWFLAQCV